MTPDFTTLTQGGFEKYEAWRRAHKKGSAYIFLHHPLLERGLIVQSWHGGQLQRARLDALQAAGYQRRRWNSTDYDFYNDAKRVGGHVIDHPEVFKQGDDRLFVFHTYHRGVDLGARVQAVADTLSEYWRCQVGVEVGQRFNFYYPESGNGFELRRYHKVRARRRRLYA